MCVRGRGGGGGGVKTSNTDDQLKTVTRQADTEFCSDVIEHHYTDVTSAT